MLALHENLVNLVTSDCDCDCDSLKMWFYHGLAAVERVRAAVVGNYGAVLTNCMSPRPTNTKIQIHKYNLLSNSILQRFFYVISLTLRRIVQ